MTATRVHHLNCGSMCPPIARLVQHGGAFFRRGLLVCHCLLVEGEGGLVLVDTGFGLEDCAQARARLGRVRHVLDARLDPLETAARQVERLGFDPKDVRDVVVTHLDLDHAGGISDFPWARVHVHGRELDAALARATFFERLRYRPLHWAHGPLWARHAVAGERWLGFECVSALEGSKDEVLLVPLEGHTRGHCAVAVRTAEGWLLHCGDAYFNHAEMDPERPSCPVGLGLFQTLVQVDRAARHANQARLRTLARERRGEVRVFCAHDPVELEALRSKSASEAEAQEA